MFTAPRTFAARCASVLVSAGLAATALTTVCASSAHAASSQGGTVTRSEIMSRAQSWVDAGVPYDEGKTYADPQGTTYRTDCSGYVSMAWHTSADGLGAYTTQTLPNISSVISNSQLLPGDALDYTAQHVILFAGWNDKAAGTFTYYAESNPSVLTNSYTGDLNASSLAGWPTSYYEGLRYNNVVDDPAQPVADAFADGSGTPAVAHNADGRLDTFVTQSNGAISRNYETSASGGWSGWNGFASAGAATSVATGVHPDGRVEVFAVQSNGGVSRNYETSAAGSWSGWTGFAPAGAVAQIRVARHPDGRLDVFALQTNGAISRNYETSPGGAWSGWTGFSPASAISSFTVGVHPDGRLDVFGVQTNGAVSRNYESTAGGAWSGWTGFASAGAANTNLSGGGQSNIAVANQADGRMNVFIVQSNGAVSRNYETAVNGSWAGWSGFASSGAAMISAPQAGVTPVSGSNITVGVHDDGRLDVVLLQSNGAISRNYQTSPNGSFSGWNGFASAGAAASVAATTHSDGRLDVIITQTNGALSRNYETSPNGSFSDWHGFTPAGAVMTY